jgi:hypothetical protein
MIVSSLGRKFKLKFELSGNFEFSIFYLTRFYCIYHQFFSFVINCSVLYILCAYVYVCVCVRARACLSGEVQFIFSVISE